MWGTLLERARATCGLPLLRLDSPASFAILGGSLEAEADIHGFFEDERWRERFEEECLLAGQRLRPKVRDLKGD